MNAEPLQGSIVTTSTLKVEADHIVRYCEATGDRNPEYREHDIAPGDDAA